jgi:ferredoxin
MTFRKIWIEEGCISCNLCEDLAPEVFHVPAGDVCRTKKGHGKLLVGDEELDERIQEAVDSCPVEVIKADEA